MEQKANGNGNLPQYWETVDLEKVRKAGNLGNILNVARRIYLIAKRGAAFDFDNFLNPFLYEIGRNKTIEWGKNFKELPDATPEEAKKSKDETILAEKEAMKASFIKEMEALMAK